MRSQSRHISKRMQLHIMCEIHKEICRLRYGGEPVEKLRTARRTMRAAIRRSVD
jgi:hypothetical protein